MYNEKTVAAIIVAGGRSTRMGKDKLLIDLCGKSVIARTVGVFSKCGFFDEIILVSSYNNKDTFAEEMKKHSYGAKIVLGGNTRGESSVAGINAAQSDIVMIHDGARPLVTKEIIENTLKACLVAGGAAAGVKSKDTIKQVDAQSIITNTVPRDGAILIQTPQAFFRKDIEDAYKNASGNETDDCAVAEKHGVTVKIVEGSYENLKLTTLDDVVTARGILAARNGERGSKSMRIGTGFDTHQLIQNRDMIIGGVKIPYEKGLLGHSDADVLIHAVIDALFGAAALGDIGTHFPDSDNKYKGISSMLLLEEATKLLYEAGYEIVNVDTTLIAQAPKMAPYIEQMRQNLSQAMNIPVSSVSVKAKTNEHMGFTGRGEGIEARATVLIN